MVGNLQDSSSISHAFPSETEDKASVRVQAWRMQQRGNIEMSFGALVQLSEATVRCVLEWPAARKEDGGVLEAFASWL